jgi:hypothetical protein
MQDTVKQADRLAIIRLRYLIIDPAWAILNQAA